MINSFSNTQASNNISMVQFKNRTPLGFSNRQIDIRQVGGADPEESKSIFQNLVKGVEMGKSAYDTGTTALNQLKKAAEFYGSKEATFIKNMLPSSSDTARTQYTGEKHAVLQLPDGKFGIANYMGPGTNLITRLKNKDPPRTESDRVAMRHDIDFALAKTLPSQEEQFRAVRKADERMVNRLNTVDDSVFNKTLAQKSIQGKMLAEDLKFLKKDAFAGKMGSISRDDMELLLKNKEKLAQQGYGVGKKLKEQLIRKENRKKGKLPSGMSIDRTFPNSSQFIASQSSSGTMGGTGVDVKEIVHSLLSKALKALNLPENTIPKNVVDILLKTAESKLTLGEPMLKIVEYITKLLGPIIGMGYMKGKGRNPAEFSHIMTNKAKRNKYMGNLAKYVLAQLSGKQKGGAWYDDLWAGIKTVLKPIANVVKPITGALAPITNLTSFIPGPVGILSKGISAIDMGANLLEN